MYYFFQTIPLFWKEKHFISNIKLFFKQNAKNYDAVHCHPAFSWFICTYFAKKFGVPIRVVHSHSIKFSDKPISAIRNFASSCLSIFTANVFIAVNEETKKLFPFVKKSKIKSLNPPYVLKYKKQRNGGVIWSLLVYAW